MATLKDALGAKLGQWKEEISGLISAHGDTKISDVTVAQAYGGMRGVKAQVCDTSTVTPDEGLIIRGRELKDLIGKGPEEIFWLLLTGDLPDAASLQGLKEDLASRADLPEFVINVLRSMPKDAHPMTMFSMGVLAMQNLSEFRRKYEEGMSKDDYWEVCLEDALNLVGKVTGVAAAVWRMRYGDGKLIAPDKSKDWSANLVHMMGFDDAGQKLADLFRLYLMIHSDHESGNASANLCHICGSTLSDPFYSVSAGLNGLAGPLHGLANQEALRFHLAVMEKFDGVPSAEQLNEFTWELLNSGRVVPGFGHAVLRCTDPRYVACHDFGKKNCPEKPLFKLADVMYEVVPSVLKEHGKAKNPYPNVDALSGVLMYSLGVTEPQFYTVIFGVSRALGMCAQLVLDRAMGMPITRPKSVTTKWLKKEVGA